MAMARAGSLLFLCMFAMCVQVESRPTPADGDTNYNYAGAEHNFQHNNFGDSRHVGDFSSSNLESEFRVKNPSSFELGEEFTYGSGAKYSEAADSGRFSANLYNADRPRIVSRDERFRTLYSYNPEQSNDESQVVDEPRMSSFNANRFASNGDGNDDVYTVESSSFASREETYTFDAATTTTETNFGNGASETYALLDSDFSLDGSRSVERANPESKFGDVSEEHFGGSSTYTFDATAFANEDSGLTLAEAPVSFDSEEHFGDVSTSSLPSSGFTRVAVPPSAFDANEDEFSGAVAKSFSPEESTFEVAQAPAGNFVAQAPAGNFVAQAPASAANFDDVSNHNASETELAPWSYDAKSDEWTTRTFPMAEAPESFHVDESNETTSFFTENSTRTISSDADSPAPESFDFSEVSFNAEYARIIPKQEDEAEAPQKNDDSSTYTNSLTNVTSEAAEAPGSSEGSNFQEFLTDTHMSNDSRTNAEEGDAETFADVDSHSLSASETSVKDSEVNPSDPFTITMPNSFSDDDDSSSHHMFAHTTFHRKPAHTFERADDAP
jgi:hypothetical protein